MEEEPYMGMCPEFTRYCDDKARDPTYETAKVRLRSTLDKAADLMGMEEKLMSTSDEDEISTCIWKMWQNLETLMAPHLMKVAARIKITAEVTKCQRDLRRVILKLTQHSPSADGPWHRNGPVLELYSEEPVAFGGFSDIYRGSILEKGNVAIKKLRSFTLSLNTGKAREQTKRLYTEYVLWASHRHPNIIRPWGIDVEIFAPSVCLLLPWCWGGHTVKFMEIYKNKHGAEKTLHLVHRWVEDITSALAYIHDIGIVHGDLRAVNILVGYSLEVQLSDFGLSILVDRVTKEMDDTYTSMRDGDNSADRVPNITGGYTSARGGATHWLAPELIDPEAFGMPDDCRPTYSSDVYSFACVMMELYTSRPPYGELNEQGAMLRISQGQRPDRPSFLYCEEGKEQTQMEDVIWAIVQECWSQDPKARPKAEEVHERIKKFRVDDCPEMPPQRYFEWWHAFGNEMWFIFD